MTPLATAPALPYQAAPMRLSVAPGAQPGTRIISMANQKGGVAKTTSTVNLAAALKERGKRVLVVDLDPQSNLTMSFGIDPEHLQQSMFDVLVHRLPIREVIQQREVDVAASSIDLAGAELALSAMIGRERTLEKALAPVRDDYDFILIDTPPSLGLLTINAFTTSTGVIVPVQLEYLSLRGLDAALVFDDEQVFEAFVAGQQKYLQELTLFYAPNINSAVHIEGILPTMVEGRTIHGREALDLLQANFHDLVFETRIKKSVKLAEAPVQGGSVLSYQPDGAGANAYRALAEEVLSRVE